MAGGPVGPAPRRRGRAPMSDINVTPLVDVMLVLLVVFMITAPLLTVGVPIDLPETEAAQLTDRDEPLVVSVDGDGRVYVQEAEVAFDELSAKLRAILGARNETYIYVRGDKAIAYGRVMEVMGSLAAAGFTKVTLMAELPAGGG